MVPRGEHIIGVQVAMVTKITRPWSASVAGSLGCQLFSLL